MAISHHPSAATKSAYLRGQLSPGASLVVECHIEICSICALEFNVLHSNDADAVSRHLNEPASSAQTPWLCATLRDEPVGRWRWAGPGIRLAFLRHLHGLGECLYLIKAKPGSRLPNHGHTGSERMVFLHGSASDGVSSFSRGDLEESGAGDEHALKADARLGCVCLIATSGSLRFKGLARLLQPLLGI